MNRPAGESARWRAIANRYASLGELAYLDSACMGVPSRGAIAAVNEHLVALHAPAACSTTDRTVELLAQFDRARRAVASLIAAEPNSIALMPSTEAGLAALAGALRLPHGANVLVSTLEFAGTVMPWRALAAEGVKLTAVPHRDGRITAEDLDANATAKTRAVVISSVQEVNGFRVDLDEVSRLCRGRGIWLIVDAIQHVGPLELDVRELAVDAVAVGGHKWLGAPFGMGFLYVAPRLWPLLEPRIPSVMAAEPPVDGWTKYLESPVRSPLDELSLPPDARKLELGALGTSMAAAGLAGAVETLLQIGPSEIASRSARLRDATCQALVDVGAQVITPPTAQPSSIVTFRSAPEIESERLLVRELQAADVLVSLRFTSGVGGVRVAPYFYNDERHIDRLVEVVGRALRRRSN